MSSWRRTFRATIAIPYIAVLLGGPFADSVIDARTFGQDSHIEAESTVRCGVGHDEYMCQLCRLVDLPACHASRQDLALQLGTHHRVGPHGWTFAENRIDRLPHDPRAPPSPIDT